MREQNIYCFGLLISKYISSPGWFNWCGLGARKLLTRCSSKHQEHHQQRCRHDSLRRCVGKTEFNACVECGIQAVNVYEIASRSVRAMILYRWQPIK